MWTIEAHIASRWSVNTLLITLRFEIVLLAYISIRTQNLHHWCTFCSTLCVRNTFVNLDVTVVLTIFSPTVTTVAFVWDQIFPRHVSIKQVLVFASTAASKSWTADWSRLICHARFPSTLVIRPRLGSYSTTFSGVDFVTILLCDCSYRKY